MRIKGQRVVPKILSTVENMLIAPLYGDGTTSGIYRAFRAFDRLQAIPDEQLRQTVRYVIGKKYVELTHDGDGTRVVLTEAGKKLVGRLAIDALKPPKQKEWDGIWRVVMFDVPETLKTRRDGFAANLKRLGFAQIQKSVFVLPHPCFEEVELLADFHQVALYITCIEGNYMEPGGPLKKHFKLKR